VVVQSLCLTRQAVRNGRFLSKSAVRASALGVVELGGANEPMRDATGEEERHPIGIDPPDERRDADRGSVRGNDLQPHYGPGAKSCSGHDFRAVIAEVHDLTGVALCPRFDDHRPGDSDSRMPPSISKVLTGYGVEPPDLFLEAT